MYLTKESLYGNSKAKFILIKDISEASGVKVLKSVSKLFSRDGVKHHFIYYENLRQDFHHDIKGLNDFNVTDAVSDPCGWTSHNVSPINLRSVHVLEKEVSGFPGVVYLDSLTPLLFHNGVHECYRTIHKILTGNPDLHLVAIMHNLIHSHLENELVEKLATTLLSFTPVEDQVSVMIQYTSGKVKKYLTECKISVDYDFLVFSEVKPLVLRAPSKKPDPTANLTFNLKLKNSEIQARSQLVLPYMQMQTSDTVEINQDMYDDEDPDDDLDI